MYLLELSLLAIEMREAFVAREHRTLSSSCVKYMTSGMQEHTNIIQNVNNATEVRILAVTVIVITIGIACDESKHTSPANHISNDHSMVLSQI